MLFRGCFRRQHSQAPRHAQVQDEMSIAEIDEEILAASLHAAHGASSEPTHGCGHRPAQSRLTHGDSRHHAASEMRREAASRHFDFRKLGMSGLLVRGTKYT